MLKLTPVNVVEIESLDLAVQIVERSIIDCGFNTAPSKYLLHVRHYLVGLRDQLWQDTFGDPKAL